MSTPNLASLLNTQADDVKRPVPLPDGTYFGKIDSHEFIESTKKKTPGVQYNISLTHAHEDVDLSDYEAEDGKPIAERQMRTTFWLSEGAQFMLTEFVESCGVTTAGRSLGEIIPQVAGQPVVLDVVRKPNTAGDGFFNEIRTCKGLAGVE